VDIVAGEAVILAVSVGCCTLIARFALTQLFRAVGIDRRNRTDRSG
jgi:hypothetical protein